jgi:Helicase conserved C-terminal domain/HNH endonuclease
VWGPDRRQGIFFRRFATKKQRRYLYRAYNGECAICHVQLSKGWHAHHVKHFADGGYTDLGNLMPVCTVCHHILHKEGAMFIPRDWQRRFIEDTFDTKRILLKGGVGIGKSFGIGMHYDNRYRNGLVDFGIILAPSQIILEGIVDAFAKLGYSIIQSKNPTSDIIGDHSGFERVPESHGIALTYAGLSDEVTDRLALWINQRRAAVYADETHHITSGEREGVQSSRVNRLIDISSCSLLTTATPFRCDKQRLSGVEYRADGICIPTFDYSYRQSVMDKHCRRLYAEPHDGMARILLNGLKVEKLVSEMSHDSPEKNGVSVDSKLIREIVRAAHVQNERDRTTNPDAAALFVSRPGKEGNEEKNAYKLAKLIEEITGVQPIVVTSDDDNSHAKIGAFKNGRGKYLVAVRMVSEGVDIPRIRNIAICTPINSESLIIQIVGRALRGQGSAHVFFPGFPWMSRVLLAMDAEAEAASDEMKRREANGEDIERDKNVIVSMGADFTSKSGMTPVGMTDKELYSSEMVALVDEYLTVVSMDKFTILMCLKNGHMSPESLKEVIDNSNGIGSEPYQDDFEINWGVFYSLCQSYGKRLQDSGYPDEYTSIYYNAYETAKRKYNINAKKLSKKYIRNYCPQIMPELIDEVKLAMARDSRLIPGGYDVIS